MQLDEIQLRARRLFREEAADLLVELEASLLELEQRPEDGPAIDRVFRAMHTLKGSGATSGFADLATFLHHVEDVFNAAREGRVSITAPLVNATLEIRDAIERYLASEPADAAAVLAAAAAPLAVLRGFLPQSAVRADAARANSPKATGETVYAIRFRPHPDFFRRGSDPGMFLDDLRALGPCDITCVADGLPPLAHLDAEACYLRWEIGLRTAADQQTVRDVFAFVEDACDLEIKIGSNQAPAPAQWRLRFRSTAEAVATPGLMASIWRGLDELGTYQVIAAPAGDLVSAIGDWELELRAAASADQITGVFLFAFDAQPVVERVGDDATQASAPPVDHPPAPSARGPESMAAGPAARTALAQDLLRVPAEKLDRLVNLVGELVMLRAQVTDACAQLPQVPPVLRGAAEGLDRLSTELREVALNVRMMPVRDTFGKFKRLVRDLSQDLGKEVELVVEGEETEMDKSMLDQLNEPLVHLVRNSLDHGIEGPDTREQAGKPRRGRLRLAAEQRGDRVWVTVADDGRGLNAEAIRQKAVARGLISPDARMSESELYQLVFLPGFSTAATISQTSGRGVGMDVVKKRIELMRGTVTLHSVPGRGAEVRLSLPLTLAIIEGLMIGVGTERYVLPLSFVREIIERPRISRDHRSSVNLVELRGRAVPYVSLRESFRLPPADAAVQRIVVIDVDGSLVGVAVDEVFGSHQTVLKPLGWLGKHVNIFSGATITGDGRVALIIDVHTLLAGAAGQASASTLFQP